MSPEPRKKARGTSKILPLVPPINPNTRIRKSLQGQCLRAQPPVQVVALFLD